LNALLICAEVEGDLAVRIFGGEKNISGALDFD